MIQKSTPYDVIIRRNYDPVNVKCLLLEHTALEKKIITPVYYDKIKTSVVVFETLRQGPRHAGFSAGGLKAV